MEYPLTTPQDATEQIAQWLRLCPVFQEWPDRRLWELAQASRAQHYPRHAQFARRHMQARDIYLVVSGSVEITSTNSQGDKFVLGLLRAGQITQLVRLMDELPFRFDGYAREDSTIVHIPAAVMEQILDAEPALWRSIARLTLRRFSLSTQAHQGQALGSLRCRVAAMLYNLASGYGELPLEAAQAELQITQVELAHMLGVSRQTVSQELGQLKQEGMVDSVGYRRIVLLDVPALLRIACEE
ncbi:MAG: Crp/Fnr family transcriptional regulator [Acidovorax sp.]